MPDTALDSEEEDREVNKTTSALVEEEPQHRASVEVCPVWP